MKQSEAIAAGFAGVGVMIILAGAVLSSEAPQLRDAIHGAGLLSMLLGAIVFLLGRRFHDTQSSSGKVSVPSGTRQTATNLAIAGATFAVGSLAAGLALARVLTPDGLLYWILLGLGALGAAAMMLGAVVYSIAVLVGEPDSRNPRRH